jgi:hypothetical protein
MQNKKIKNTYFISNEIITGERYLAKSIENDLQGNVIDEKKYDKNGELTRRIITKRYKNNIVSERSYTKMVLNFFYIYYEHTYDEKDLLKETMGFSKLGKISLRNAFGIEEDKILWRCKKKIERPEVFVYKYKYDEKNRLIWQSNYNSALGGYSESETVYYYNGDDLAMIKKSTPEKLELSTTIIQRSNDKQHKISNTYDKNGALDRAVHTVFNPDGTKSINSEVLNDGKATRYVYRYNKEGNLIEDGWHLDFEHKSTRRLIDYDKQTGLMKGYSEFSTENGIEKLSKQIEYDFVHEYF